MRQLLAVSALAAALAIHPAAMADQGPANFSVQVRAVPMDQREDGLATMRHLISRGYLAYSYPAEVNGSSWLRVAVGAFASRRAAAEFGMAFAAAEDMDYFVTTGPIQVVEGADIMSKPGRELVVTPNALWLRDSGGARRAFDYTVEPPPLPERTAVPASLSPAGDAVAFVVGGAAYAAPLDGGPVVALTGPDHPGVSSDPDYLWRPLWSPSGRYVAFLDQAYWEYPIGLWVARADGGGLRCLACNRNGQSAVKWFAWHPSDDRVLFVEGYSHGTVAVGGGLYSADVDGAVRTIIPADPSVGWQAYEEIAGPLRFEDGYLHFRRVRWLDDNYVQNRITDDRLPIDAIR